MLYFEIKRLQLHVMYLDIIQLDRLQEKCWRRRILTYHEGEKGGIHFFHAEYFERQGIAGIA